MSPLRCLLVDDERLARVELRAGLEEAGGCTVVGEAGSVPLAVGLIGQLQPDLLFLDIEMPGPSGFDLLAEVAVCPPVIFVTAYADYAVRAFAVEALDYLLKPVGTERLRQTLDRARAAIEEEEERLFFPGRGGGRFVKLTEVSLFRAYDHYVRLYHPAGTDLLQRPLRELESRLDKRQFFRVNRSEIVRVSDIAGVETLSRGRYTFTLRNGERVRVSERRAVAWRRVYGR